METSNATAQINIATNEIIPKDQITPSDYLEPIYSKMNREGDVKFYVENRRRDIDYDVKLCNLNLGDIVLHNFTPYDCNEYYVVSKITDKQVQFTTLSKWLVGYSGERSYNHNWYKFSPTNLDPDAKPYKMNKTLSRKGMVVSNHINRYKGDRNNMYSSRRW